MTTKNGRPRRYAFVSSEPKEGPELVFLLGLLDELVVRTEDQISHLPRAALNYVARNSTLSIGRLVLHLVGADLRMLSTALDVKVEPPYQPQLANTTSDDFDTAPGDLAFSKTLLRAHLVYRRLNLLDRCHQPGFLVRRVEHPYCRTNRELLNHLAWHWTYHSGQIGLLALEAGHDYVWTSATKTS